MSLLYKYRLVSYPRYTMLHGNHDATEQNTDTPPKKMQKMNLCFAFPSGCMQHRTGRATSSNIKFLTLSLFQ